MVRMEKDASSGSGLGQQAVRLAGLLVFFALGYSFWRNEHWLTLCAGLALFLFGMQCLEEGLRNLAGSALERMLARGTSTSWKSLLVGLVGATTMQSSTLVSLMTIAFITTGLIVLPAGIAIIFGANLGSATGIWLLALAGQNFSLSAFALPLLVFGVLASFLGPKMKAFGRILLGIAFIFLGIEQIKEGFSVVTGNLNLAQYDVDGWLGRLIFAAVGLVLTLLLQSTHATLMLALTALGLGQVGLWQAAAIAIGANVGSSVTTGIAGALGGNRSGQRLALAHVIFNVVTAILALLVMDIFVRLAIFLTAAVGLGDNQLIMLAFFNSQFNILGVLLFWPMLQPFARFLERVLPVSSEPRVLIPHPERPALDAQPLQARYLDKSALSSLDTAGAAVVRELQHLGRLSIEVICNALYLPVSEINRAKHDDAVMRARPDDDYADADFLYRRYIKGVYGDILSFIGKVELPEDKERRAFWMTCQMVALQLVEIVKDAKHLQKNLGFYLRQDDSPVREGYVELRHYLIKVLHDVRLLTRADAASGNWEVRQKEFADRIGIFELDFSTRLFALNRAGKISGMQLSSLLNDLGYARRIAKGLNNLLEIRKRSKEDPLRSLSEMFDEDTPLVAV
ncbi:Na/Pi cotransporter family protein [Brucella anthropi]|uniref:Na/Pi cotransporter family protein n=1 Tax=Brucella anthropi TaxID=529 RepID=UPI002361C57C|nr:Na/Pi symporter [Brucella anthropi]